MRHRTSGLLVAAAVSLASGASAGAIDGVAPALCATVETFECAPNSSCIRDSPEAIALPRFIRLDFAGKTAIAERIGGGEPLTAEILTSQVQQGRLLLQGMQNGNAWSLTVSQATGAMSLTVSGDDVGYVIFGSCTGL